MLAVLTAWGMALSVNFSKLAGCAATSAKVLAAVGEATAGDAEEADGGEGHCFFASLHFLLLSTFQARLLSPRFCLLSVGIPASIWQEKSTQTVPRRR